MTRCGNECAAQVGGPRSSSSVRGFLPLWTPTGADTTINIPVPAETKRQWMTEKPAGEEPASERASERASAFGGGWCAAAACCSGAR